MGKKKVRWWNVPVPETPNDDHIKLVLNQVLRGESEGEADLMKELVVLDVPRDATDEEIDQATRQAVPLAWGRGEGFPCTLNGFGDDPRELYEIPEAAALCKRLVERGFLSCLEVSCLLARDEKPWLGGSLGALEVYAIANGLYKKTGEGGQRHHRHRPHVVQRGVHAGRYRPVEPKGCRTAEGRTIRGSRRSAPDADILLGARGVMIEFIPKGDLFQSGCAALVNPVNCVGVMGKGLAAMFKHRYPAMNAEYIKRCGEGALRPGVMHVWQGPDVCVINFPTKDDFRRPSTYPTSRKITSLAIPALGCGLGGLSWPLVKRAIQLHHDIFWTGITVKVYEPQEN